MLKAYAYSKCETCQKALKFLRQRSIAFEEFSLRETPPTILELKAMLRACGNIRRLFNTSGADYKALRMSERLSKISEAGALELLTKNGNLVKRPFLTGDGVNLVGFDEAEWEAAFARNKRGGKNF